MKKNSLDQRKELHVINQRLSGIENTLRKIEGNIIETKDSRKKLENILVELTEVKQYLAKKNNRQPRKRRGKGEAEVQTAPATAPKRSQAAGTEKSSLEDLLGNTDFAQIVNLLQNPMVQSMLKNIL